jgi:hypothetical protein
MMDLIITPGDYGQSYDKGPTAGRKDSLLVKPISIFNPKTALSRADARSLLGLDLNRPAVLVQLGIGEADLNAKLTAALEGLTSWSNLQVVLTKEPIDSAGINLAPNGLDLKVIRHFPLANVLNAFDAAICAAGYNSVHEELAARIPTLFIPNTRGTDNQAARAAWAADNKVALTVDQSNLSQITLNASKLSDSTLRAELSKNCESLPKVTGAVEVSNIFKDLLIKPTIDKGEMAQTLFKLKIQDIFGRGWRGTVYAGLQMLTVLYRTIKPHKEVEISKAKEIKTYHGDEDDQLRSFIKSGNPFEHLISGASAAYKDRRIEIASKAYLK